MKTINNGVTSEVTGALSSKRLTIATNAKMFKELISGIYSDKAYAIARETFANCVDSHVAAGTPERQFVVHVPSIIEPWYSVRDFGTSMSHETVENLYTSLGSSSKDDPNSDSSNLYVGKFGLGSKSPFAYTDSFQVTAFLDGRARIYDIFFNAGEPECALLSDEPSDEEQGILVSFGVDPKDIGDFTRAIKRAAEGLDVEPVFQGHIEPHKREVKAEGDGWKLLDSTQSGYAEARQGTVLYPLNFQAVIDCPAELRALFSQPFRFDFPIGSLDIVTSREALSYDEETSANIIKRLQAVQADIMARIKNDISGATTYWEFCQSYFKAMGTFPESRFGKLMADKPKFKGKEPRSNLTVDTHNRRVEYDVTSNDGTVTKAVRFEFRFGKLTYCKIEGREWNNTITFREDRDRRSNRLELSTDRDLVVVTEDMREKNRYPAARIRKLIDKLARELSPAARSNTTIVWFRHEGDSDFAFKRLFAAFGRPKMTVYNLMDIEHIVPPRQYQSGPRMPFKKLSDKGDWVTPAPGTPIPTEAYWVPMRNGDVDFSHGYQFSPMFMAEILPTLVAFGAEDLPIIGIPASSRKLVQSNPDWHHFIDFVRANAPSMFEADTYKRARQAKMTRHLPSVATFIDYIGSTVRNKKLLKDAMSEPLFRTILQAMQPTKVTDDDNRQMILFNILQRLEDQRVGEAKKANAERRQAMLDAGEDPDADDVVYLNEGHAMYALRDEAEKEYADETIHIDQLGDQIVAAYPLLGFIDSSTFRWKNPEEKETGVTEVLNYIVNKRLSAENADDNAVDTSAAA